MFILLISFQKDILAQVQVSIYDSLDNKPITFAHVIYENTSFQDYTNIEGQIELPTGVNYCYISCLGYETIYINVNDYLSSPIYLIISSYSLQVISIEGKKLDIYKDIEKVRKKLKNAKSHKFISTKTTFDLIYNDNSIGLGEVYCRDELVEKNGFGETERLHSNYSFDPNRLFLNVDRLIKNVNPTEKLGLLHLLNSGKIKRKTTELTLVEEWDSLYIVSFSTANQTGFINYNKHNYLLEEYRVLDHKVDKSFYSSINKDKSANIDTLILDYRFEHGWVKNVSFYYSTKVQSIGTIKTNGVIEKTDFSNKKYSTNLQLSSIQFDAFVSDFSLCHPRSSTVQIFYDKNTEKKELIKNDTLSVALLQKYGYALKFQLWD
ncbi:MAG: hypothetical protein ACJATI_003881 [Halioglobus sp.]